MKRILEENQTKRTKVYCEDCQTLFDYQSEDVEKFQKDWIEKEKWQYPDTHYYREKLFVTCPKCGKEHVISDRTWSKYERNI